MTTTGQIRTDRKTTSGQSGKRSRLPAVHSVVVAFGETVALLFPIVNPAAVAPIFVAFTAGRTSAERAALLRRVVLLVAVVLISFAILGEQLLTAMGISLEALQIAGGVI